MEKLKISVIVLLSVLLFLPQAFLAQTKRSSSERKTANNQADFIIVNGTIVTMDSSRRVIANGALAVKDGEIVAVGTRAEVAANFRSRRLINASGKFVIPGLVNAHTHVPMVLFRGISDDLDLNDWLTRYIFPAEAKNLDEEFVRAGTRLGLAEMIRGGTTTYCDMYYFEDAIADETFKAGVRGVLGETVIDFPVADNKTHEEAMKYTENFIGKWKNNPLITPAIAPHAPYTVSTEHLKNIKNLSDKLSAPIVIHVSETMKENNDIINRYGARPVQYLEKIEFLNERVIAAHTVHITSEDIDILKKREVGSAHCPQSNMKLASGVAPVVEMLAKNIRLGLGTDSAASNNDLNMWEEIDSAAKLHKVFTKDPKVTSAEEVFMMATIGGARALHLEDKIGSLEQGKRADIVIVDADSLNQTPSYNVYSSLVYSTKADNVNTVIIDGKIVMLAKRLLTLNENAIKKDANLYRQKIIKSLSVN